MTDSNASRRLYSRHQRHDHAKEMRYSDQKQAFLTAQATRLSTTEAILFAKLTKYTAAQIAAASSLGGLP